MGVLPLFDYRLLPIDEVHPWGEPPKVHYFALTEGASWIRVGREELFRYSPQMLQQWKQAAGADLKSPGALGSPHDVYDLYFVIRLAEDLREALRAALEPVPPDLAALVEGTDRWRLRSDVQSVTSGELLDLQEQRGISDGESLDQNCAALGWWDERRLNGGGYLKYPPRIHIWSNGAEVEIRWDNRRHVMDGIPVWSAQFGSFRLPTESFLSEVRRFYDRFFSEMRLRVEAVKKNWSRPGIAIDTKAMDLDRADFEGIWDFARNPRPVQTNWDAVRSAVEQLRRFVQ